MICDKHPRQPVDILFVDDSPEAALIARHALEDTELIHRLHIVQDGVEALEFLHREGRHSSAPRPAFILLDLKMPRLGGINVLKKIKSDEHLKDIPVIIMTSSQSRQDMLDCYREHANCYVNKPLDLDESIACLKAITDFWTTVSLFPAAKEDQ